MGDGSQGLSHSMAPAASRDPAALLGTITPLNTHVAETGEGLKLEEGGRGGKKGTAVLTLPSNLELSQHQKEPAFASTLAQ